MTDEEVNGVLQTLRKKLSEAQSKEGATPLAGDDAFIKQLSYVLGADIGTDLKRSQLEVKNEPFVHAIEDVINDRKMAMTQDEMKVVLDGFRQKQMEKMKAVADKNLAEGEAFLIANAKKPGVKSTASGLQYLVVTEGKGEMPKATDTVKTHYRGTLIDGTEFDSSYARNEPTEFPVNQVIKGWTEALQLMHVGDKWKLFIPANLAYGERGAGADIGPNSTLIFDIELLEVIKAKEEPASDGTISLDAGTGSKPAK
ncbi:MAG: FKBP-type peptidyl-prolyl cis-trans isomerase [Candidatus Hydrogenedentes bacterium]|nr:FKBP-type peptidyl-prolyl cis-trans isomerase [Candidatus Hydrogenedentota bacterium]